LKENAELRNHLRAVRLRLKLSQQELATAAGVARQTVGGIESELYAPSAVVAIKLARALGCTVDELFWLESDREQITATVATSSSEFKPAVGASGLRVALARISDRWIAYPLHADTAFRMQMIPADGLAKRLNGEDTLTVEIIDDQEDLARTVVVAGCAPALSLWATSAERWFPGLRVHWQQANSLDGLRALASGEAHIAGIHLSDTVSGSRNREAVRTAVQDVKVSLVHLGVWTEGLLVAAGNPQNLRSVEDLHREDVRIVNREEGSGSRLLLDNFLVTLQKRGCPGPEDIIGYNDCVSSHREIAARIAVGSASVGIGPESIAAVYGLGFVPLASVRYDLAILDAYLDLEPVRQLLSTLQHRSVQQQLAVSGGFDTTLSGEIESVR